MIKSLLNRIAATAGAFGLALSLASAAEENKKVPEPEPVKELVRVIKDKCDNRKDITERGLWSDSGRKIGTNYRITIKGKKLEGKAEENDEKEWKVMLSYNDMNPEGIGNEDSLYLLIDGRSPFLDSPVCIVNDYGLDGFKRGRMDTALINGDIAIGFLGRKIDEIPSADQIPTLNDMYARLTRSLKEYIEKRNPLPKPKK